MSELETGGAPAPATGAPAIDTTPPAVGATPEAASAPVETKEPTLDETLSAAWDKAQTGNERGEGGKFVSDKPKETTESAVQPTIEAIEPAAPAIDPPSTWTAEAKANWAKLPPEVQQYVAQRESETHKAITSQGERVKSFEPLEKVITEYRDEFAKRSLAPDQGIRVLLEAQRMFDADPLGAATHILMGYGIDLRPFLSGQQGSIPASDPVVGQLRQELASVKGELHKYTHEHRASQEAADVAAVNEFASKTDAGGKPLHPHFNEVRQDMAKLFQSGLVDTLEKAYAKACQLNDSISKRIEADQRKADEAKRKADDEAKQAELKKRAEEAAKSAKVNVRSGTASPNPKTMDDTLDEIARRHYG